MIDIHKARYYLRLCNLAEDWDKYRLWHGYAHELCGDCCPECTTPKVLIAFYPELETYKERATPEDLKNEIEIASKEYSDYRKKRLEEALETLLEE